MISKAEEPEPCCICELWSSILFKYNPVRKAVAAHYSRKMHISDFFSNQYLVTEIYFIFESYRMGHVSALEIWLNGVSLSQLRSHSF